MNKKLLWNVRWRGWSLLQALLEYVIKTVDTDRSGLCICVFVYLYLSTWICLLEYIIETVNRRSGNRQGWRGGCRGIQRGRQFWKKKTHFLGENKNLLENILLLEYLFLCYPVHAKILKGMKCDIWTIWGAVSPSKTLKHGALRNYSSYCLN